LNPAIYSTQVTNMLNNFGFDMKHVLLWQHWLI
jgi:hypothetical protein